MAKTTYETAKILGITRFGVCDLIKRKRLKAKMKSISNQIKWRIPVKSIKDYQKTKFKRSESTLKNGKKAFNEKEGRLTVEQAAKYGNLDKNQLYYAIKHHLIAYRKVGAQYILKKENVAKYARKYHKCRIDMEI